MTEFHSEQPLKPYPPPDACGLGRLGAHQPDQGGRSTAEGRRTHQQESPRPGLGHLQTEQRPRRVRGLARFGSLLAAYGGPLRCCPCTGICLILAAEGLAGMHVRGMNMAFQIFSDKPFHSCQGKA